MRLRTQLLLVSLLTLTLPWASCQYVREMENVQRQVQRDALVATAHTITTTIPSSLHLNPFLLIAKKDDQRDSYAYQLSSSIVLDGFADDWQLTSEHRQLYRPILDRNGLQVSALTGRDNDYVYLHLEITDEKVVYPGAGKDGDKVILVVIDKEFFTNRYTLSTTAPGPVSVQVTGEKPAGKSLTGYWHETVAGYNVELRLPAGDLGLRLGFLIKDVDQSPDDAFVIGSLAPNGTAFYDDIQSSPGVIRYRDRDLEAHLEQFSRPNLRMRIVDPEGWVLARVGALVTDPAPLSDGFWDHLYRRLLDEEEPDTNFEPRPAHVQAPHTQNALAGRPSSNWSKGEEAGSATVAAAYPIYNGSNVAAALLLEQSSHHILLLGDADSVGFINKSLLLTVAVALVLLGYASYLSVRVQRLRNAADSAVSSDGQLQGDFPTSSAGDEIGDLSRSFGTLFRRVQDYTNYLETLAGRLSHELRTPLTIVRSSLDNLVAESKDGPAEKYAQRAQEGTQRLNQILTAMSEASRLEQSIRDHDVADFDIVGLLNKHVAACAEVYADHDFDLQVSCEEFHVYGSPDLIGQLLDKLVNNAVDFTDERKRIGLEFHHEQNTCQIHVWNYGSELPSTMTGRLFDSMVSVRPHKGKSTHLGLGLHIARMIAEFHGGHIRAANLNKEKGAKFSITLSKGGPGKRT